VRLSSPDATEISRSQKAARMGAAGCAFARSRAASHDAKVLLNPRLSKIAGLERLDLVLEELSQNI